MNKDQKLKNKKEKWPHFFLTPVKYLTFFFFLVFYFTKPMAHVS